MKTAVLKYALDSPARKILFLAGLTLIVIGCLDVSRITKEGIGVRQPLSLEVIGIGSILLLVSLAIHLRQAKKPTIPAAVSDVSGSQSRPERFICRRISAEGLLDLSGIDNPYAAPDPTSDKLGQTSRDISCYLWVPHFEYLNSSHTESTPAVAICCTSPEILIGRLSQSTIQLIDEKVKRGFGPSKLHEEKKKEILNSMQAALPNCFVVAVILPTEVVGNKQGNGRFSYQAIANLFLSPLVEAHRRFGTQQFRCRLCNVGENGFLLGPTKRVLKTCLPSEADWTAKTVKNETGVDSTIIYLGRMLAWAITAHYNRGDERWLRLVAEIVDT